MYKDINKLTGLSFDDFLDRPRYEIEKIVKLVDLFRKKEEATTKGVLNELKNPSK